MNELSMTCIIHDEKVFWQRHLIWLISNIFIIQICETTSQVHLDYRHFKRMMMSSWHNLSRFPTLPFAKVNLMYISVMSSLFFEWVEKEARTIESTSPDGLVGWFAVRCRGSHSFLLGNKVRGVGVRIINHWHCCFAPSSFPCPTFGAGLKLVHDRKVVIGRVVVISTYHGHCGNHWLLTMVDMFPDERASMTGSTFCIFVR